MTKTSLSLLQYLPFGPLLVAKEVRDLAAHEKNKGDGHALTRHWADTLENDTLVRVSQYALFALPFITLSLITSVNSDAWIQTHCGIVFMVNVGGGALSLLNVITCKNVVRKMRLSLPRLLVLDHPAMSPDVLPLMYKGPDIAVQTLQSAGWSARELDELDASVRLVEHGQATGVRVCLEGRSRTLLERAISDLGHAP